MKQSLYWHQPRIQEPVLFGWGDQGCWKDGSRDWTLPLLPLLPRFLAAVQSARFSGLLSAVVDSAAVDVEAGGGVGMDAVGGTGSAGGRDMRLEA